MDHGQDLRMPHAPEAPPSVATSASGKAPWQEPKLTFVEPTLTPHGTVQEVTGQSFFRQFSP
jgi:hypothetical protein